MSEKKIQKDSSKSSIYVKRLFEKWVESCIFEELSEGCGIDPRNKKKLQTKYSLKIRIS